ncbi:glycosyltransferase family 2 protein [Candidatus Pseudothioglobus singularis]|nr:glycosyltransferase family 2 protein [Candidatus Pseudothioglobus singularis]
MEKNKLGIVIPAFNEEQTIAQVVNSAKVFGFVIVVDDASNDRTTLIAEASGAIIVRHKINKGYDKSINSGFKKALELNCDAVITFDADGQHSTEMIPTYINHLNKGVDLVLGVRPKTQRFSEMLFGLYTKRYLNWKDPLCGMKGYSMKIYKNLGHFDSFSSIGTELAFFGLSNKYKFKEVNIPEIGRIDSPRFATLFTSNKLILLSLLKNIKKYGL